MQTHWHRRSEWSGPVQLQWDQLDQLNTDIFNIMDVEQAVSTWRNQPEKLWKQLVMTQIYISGQAATSSGRSNYSGSKGGREEKKLKEKMRIWSWSVRPDTAVYVQYKTKSTVSFFNLLLKLE